MKKGVLLLLLLAATAQASAQPLTGCDDPPVDVLASFCADACILCDGLDGFIADNDSPIVGAAPSQFCATGLHNVNWLGFVAGSTDLELEVTVYNCSGLDDDNNGLSDGLQIGVYSTTNCSVFQEVMDCAFQAEESTTVTFGNTVPLTPGGVYFFVVDGFNGDVCDFSVDVVSGSATAPDVAQIAPVIDAPTETCPGGTISFGVENLIFGAGIYTWTLNGNVVATDPSGTLTMPTTGGDYELCVTPSNPCSQGIQTCQTITVETPEIIWDYVTICEGEIYVWPRNNNFYFLSGIYPYQQFVDGNCFQEYRLQLTVNEPWDIDVDADICPGESYTIENPYTGQTFTYSSSGSYTAMLTDAGGCDSIVNLDLSLNPAYDLEVDVTICEGESYTVTDGSFSQDLSSAGTFNFTLNSRDNCDSVVTVNLAIAPIPQPTDVLQDICPGATYQYHGQSYSAGGPYSVLLETQFNGCDSLVNLFVNEVDANSFVSATICEGDSYFINGQFFDNQGDYSIVLPNANYLGCDSIVNLDLTVTPAPESNVSATICQGEAFPLGGQLFTDPGQYTVVADQGNGCDEILNLDLEVISIVETFLDETICDGEAYVLDGIPYEDSGSYIAYLTSVGGCDSTVYLELQVRPENYQNLGDVVCEGESYFFEGMEITDPGQYTFTYTDSFGCDSIVDFFLTHLPAFDTTLDAAICEGQSYNLGGASYTTPGAYTATFQAQNGCDSVVTVNLSVSSALMTDVDEQICAGESVTVGGQTFSSPGDYTITLTSSGGCDSIISLTVTEVAIITQTDEVTICDGESVSVDGNTYTTTGIYDHPYTTASGCDSIYQLDLTVLPSAATTLDETICQGSGYALGGMVYDTTGQYLATLTGANGCDSLVTLNLSVSPPPVGLTTETLCAGDTLFANGQAYFETGVYETMHATAEGCDSLHQLDLTVLPPLTSTIDREICDGSSLQIGGQTFTAAGQYMVALTTAGGCDSLVTLNLSITESLLTTLQETICEGEVAFINTTPYTATGTYEESFVTPEGCDSLVRLELTVVEPVVTDLTPTICQGDSFSAGGQTFTMTGAYSIPLTSAAGCDSTVNVNLTVTPPPVGMTETTICAGDTAYLGGVPYTTTGVYQDLFATAAGCDSLHELNLTVLPEATGAVSPVLCEGESFSLGGQTFTATGQYTVVLNSVAGCDSTVTVDLTVNEVFETNLVETVCAGGSFTVGGTPYDATGSYQQTFTAANGCDSVVNLDLTVLPAIFTPIAAQICEGASYDLAGMSYSNSGNFTGVLTAANGCDSTVQLELTVLPTPEVFIDATICEGGVYNVGSSSFTDAGDYTVTLSTVAGCDSTVNLQLEIATFYETNLAETICEGESAQFDGNTLTDAGTYMAQYTSLDGCDSLVNFVLAVNPLPRDTVLATICEGESYSIGGVAYTTPGEHQETLPSAVTGCDSTIVLLLDVLPVYADTLESTVCFGETVEVGDSTYTASGQYVTPLVSSQGCDSTVTLNLTVLELPETFLTEEICTGESFGVGDSLYVASGAYTNVLTAASGCDSIVYLDLIVHPLPETPVSAAICEGETYAVGTESFSTAGMYTITLPAAAATGCDSIVLLDLVVNEVFTTDLSETICDGDSFNLGPETFTASGDYSVTLSTQAGCDSTVNLSLTVIPCALDYTFSATDVSCAGGDDGTVTFALTTGTPPYTYTYGGGNGAINGNNENVTLQGLPAGVYNIQVTDANEVAAILTITVAEPPPLSLGLDAPLLGADHLSCAGAADGMAEASANGGTPPYTYAWSNGASGALVNNLAAGAYQVTVTDAQGCTAEASVELTEPTALAAEVVTEDPACFNDEEGLITVAAVDGGTPPYLYALEGGAFSAGATFAGLAVGDYTVQVQDANGCEVATTVRINEAEQLTVDLGETITMNFGDSVRLRAQVGPLDAVIAEYRWTGGPVNTCPGQSDTNCARPWVSPEFSTTYTVVVVDENGCTATDMVNVNVARPREVFVPSAFSPNGDGTNELLIIYGGGQVARIDAFRIFNRWGELVFEAYGFQPENPDAAWDGTHRGEPLNAGVFVYMIEVTYLDGETRVFSGDVVLMK